MYTITQNFIQSLPKIPFRYGVGDYEGVVAHATAVYNDTAEGERSYESTHWNDAFVHFFVDDDTILQVADTRYEGWGAGHTANQRYIHFELCQTHDPAKFEEGYKRWVFAMAYVLHERKLSPKDKVTLWSHAEISNTFHETDHQDPISYLSEHGKTWEDVVKDVTDVYNSFDGTAVPTQQSATHIIANTTVVQAGMNGEIVKEVQQLLVDHGYKLIVDGAFGDHTKTAVEQFQKDHGLQSDGIVGTHTWAELEKKPVAVAPAQPQVQPVKSEPSVDIDKLPTLRRGTDGEYVKLLQEKLNKKSLCNLKVDGDFGALTEQEVMKFQHAQGITVDGIVGKQTWSRLV